MPSENAPVQGAPGDPLPPPLAPVPSVPLPPSAPSPSPAPEWVSIEEFGRIKLVTAKVIEARPHPKADRLMILGIEVGERRKQIVAGIRLSYTPESLVGRTIIIVDNLKPAKLRGEVSEGMLLAVSLPEGPLRLLTTDGPAPSGRLVS